MAATENKTDKPTDRKAQEAQPTTDPDRDALIASGEKRQPRREELGRGFGGGVGRAEK